MTNFMQGKEEAISRYSAIILASHTMCLLMQNVHVYWQLITYMCDCPLRAYYKIQNGQSYTYRLQIRYYYVLDYYCRYLLLRNLL